MTLQDIKSAIAQRDFTLPPDEPEWGGADVIIRARSQEADEKWAADQPFVIDADAYVPRHRLVITKHAKELTWLFCEFREYLSGQMLGTPGAYPLSAYPGLGTKEKTESTAPPEFRPALSS